MFFLASSGYEFTFSLKNFKVIRPHYNAVSFRMNHGYHFLSPSFHKNFAEHVALSG